MGFSREGDEHEWRIQVDQVGSRITLLAILVSTNVSELFGLVLNRAWR